MSVNKLSIKNFKVFKYKTEFELAPIALLIGPNNS
jgi:predicted ATPase